MAAFQATNPVPQGFSVFQPMLGAPLQFFPALGTKELDDMLDAYIPGPSSLKEKRATVSVDFLDYTQRTGQVFKFYAVTGLTAAVPESPSAVSPLQATPSVASLNASPITSNWDWSSVTGPTPSRASPSAGASRKSSTTSSRRHTPTDFSHLPGMKILTRDGMDVTNSASRGSKTKEQRDHAHLMRIIKACDSCRKKKIRCDPSHKKRGASSQTQTHPATKPIKKSRTVSQDKPDISPPAPVIFDAFTMPEAPSIDFDPSLEFVESFDMSTAAHEPWEDFIHYPPSGVEHNYDFFSDPQGILSQGQQTSSSSSMSPFISSSDDQLFSQTFSSTTSASDSPDYGIFQTVSSSTSPEMPDLDWDFLASDQLMLTAPEIAGRDRHVLPHYPMPPLVATGNAVDAQDSSGISSQPTSEPALPTLIDVGNRVARSQGPESCYPRVIGDHLQSQTKSPEGDGVEAYANTQSASSASPGLDRHGEHRSGTGSEQQCLSEQYAQSVESQWRGQNSDGVEAFAQSQSEINPAVQDGIEGVAPPTTRDTRGGEDGIPPLSSRPSCSSCSQLSSPVSRGLVNSHPLVVTENTGSEAESSLVADEHVESQISSPGRLEAQPTSLSQLTNSIVTRSRSLRVVSRIIQRTESTTTSSYLEEMTSRSLLEELESRVPGSGVDSIATSPEGSNSVLVSGLEVSAVGAALQTPQIEIPELQTLPRVVSGVEILARAIPTLGVPAVEELSLAASQDHWSSASSAALTGVAIYAALQLFSMQKKTGRARGLDSWMVQLLGAIALVAFASCFSSSR
ncbi:hypothetical protein ACO1O0_005704 [Amphichorda felina]